jgi:hypothetical protein
MNTSRSTGFEKVFFAVASLGQEKRGLSRGGGHHQNYTIQTWVYMAMSELQYLSYVSGAWSQCQAMLGNSISDIVTAI